MVHTQVAEFFYGLFMATEVAYLTYMYAVCDKKHFQKVSGCVRSGILLGRFASGITSQVTVSFKVLSYHQLNFLTLAGKFSGLIPRLILSSYFFNLLKHLKSLKLVIYYSLAGVSLSVLVAAFLPSVKRSMYFHRKPDHVSASRAAREGSAVSLENRDLELDGVSSPEFEVVHIERRDSRSQASILSSETAISEAFRAMLSDFKSSFKNTHVLKWSIWWALATCGYLQVCKSLLWFFSSFDNFLLNLPMQSLVFALTNTLL